MMSDFRSDDSFPVKTRSLGQISIIPKIRHIILQNEALYVHFSDGGQKRSSKVKNRGKRPERSNFEIHQKYTNNTSK